MSVSIDPSLLSQIHLSAETSCQQFTPHILKANFCTACSKLINKHTPSAIPNDQCLLKALEFSQKGEKTPSCILPPSDGDGVGGLFHGGYKGVMNAEFLRKEGVTHILNTAKGLDIFGPNYLKAVATAETELGISFLKMDWEDTITFSIPESDLVRCVQFIHEARVKGGSVVVHCAQGKSRSATAVVAYLMTCYNGKGAEFQEALQIAQEQRKMAEPNPTFVQILQAFGKSKLLSDLRKNLNPV